MSQKSSLLQFSAYAIPLKHRFYKSHHQSQIVLHVSRDPDFTVFNTNHKYHFIVASFTFHTTLTY